MWLINQSLNSEYRGLLQEWDKMDFSITYKYAAFCMQYLVPFINSFYFWFNEMLFIN